MLQLLFKFKGTSWSFYNSRQVAKKFLKKLFEKIIVENYQIFQFSLFWPHFTHDDVKPTVKDSVHVAHFFSFSFKCQE